MFRAILQVFAVVALLFHLERVGVGVFQGIASLVVGIAWFGIYISQIVEQLGVLVEGVHTAGADFHTINLCFGDVVELCPDAEAFAVFQHLDGIVYTVNHAQVGVIEQAELEFHHILVLRIESGKVCKTLQVADLVSLLETEFGVKTFFGLYVVVGIYAYTSDVLTQILFGEGRVSVTLPEAGAQEAVVGKLIIQSGAEYGTERDVGAEYLCVGFPVVLVYPVVFAAYAGRYTEAVPEALVLLEEGGDVIALMHFFRIA